jgi:taurine dioxygenase
MVEVRRVGSALGAEVLGVDCAKATPALVDEIRAALAEHQVVFFRGQDMTHEQFVEFGRNFAELNVHEALPNLGGELEVTQVLDSKGSLARLGGRSLPWHADSTFLEAPPGGAMLLAVELPPVGGDTLFSSMYAAHDTLSGPMQELLAGLTAAHYFRDRTVDRAYHPVVAVHPVTGRRALFVNDTHTSRIVELSPAESDAILDLVYAHNARPEIQIRWSWQRGDLAFWDNRAVQHFAVGDYTDRRVMHRLSLAGPRPVGPSGEPGAPVRVLEPVAAT